MEYEEPILSDIMTEDLVFYDKENEEECLSFCEKRDISYLPSHEGDYVYEYIDGQFRKRELSTNQIVSVDENVFSNELLNKFSENEVLFVEENEKLVGVVHFADFNCKEIYCYLYSRIYDLETSMRKLLRSEGMSEEDLAQYYRSKTKNTEKEFYQRRLNELSSTVEERSITRPFQEVYLQDLITLIHNNRNTFNLKLDQKTLKELRNHIMHEKQFVKHKDYDEFAMHYEFDSFESFFQDVKCLEKTVRRIENKLNFHN